MEEKCETMVHDHNNSTNMMESPLTKAQKGILNTARRVNHIMKTSEARKKCDRNNTQKRARHFAEIHASFIALKQEPIDMPEYREVVEHIADHIGDLNFKHLLFEFPASVEIAIHASCLSS